MSYEQANAFHSNMIPPDIDTRERRILDLVRDRGLLDIGALAQQFGVTPQAVRRSVNRLSERGLLRCVHGGVTLPAAGTSLPWETRQVQHLEYAAVRCFVGFKTDYAVFGVGGIDEDGALLDFDPAEVAAREAMRQNCRQSLLVADASKFGRAALARGAHLADIDHLFIDALPGPAFRPLLDGGRPCLHLAEETAG